MSTTYTTPNREHLTVEAQAERLPLYLREFYKTRQLDRIKIDNNEIQGYFEYSYFDEISYVKSPIRSNAGVIDNLDSYATFLTPRLVIKYNYMHIGDYRKLMLLLRSKNEFVVECYDIVLDRRVTHKMYFAPPEMPAIHQKYLEVLGIKNYTIELIGTNADLDTVSVTYHFNPPLSSGGADTTIGSDSVPKGSEIVVGSIAASIKDNAPSGWKFKHWNTSADDKGVTYTDSFAATLNESLVLFAIWEKTDNYTLNFNYGHSAPYIENYKEKYSTPVVYGQSIGTLPPFEKKPAVIIDEEEYYPYQNGAWYKTPTKTSTSVPLISGLSYWAEGDTTLYLIYDTIQYKVSYYLEGSLYSEAEIEYNVSVPLPTLYKTGYKFDGWYSDSAYTKKFSGKMPPYPIPLYAKWVSN